jgi:CHASE3 domain sensor protein
LRNAAFDEQNYLLTGDATWSDAYGKDVATWNDEHATLRLVAANDRMLPSVDTVESNGKRAVEEMEAVMSVIEQSGRNAALARLRMGTALRLINKARDGNSQIQDVYGGISTSPPQNGFVTRIFEAAMALTVLGIAAGILANFSARGEHSRSGARSDISTVPERV